MSVLLDLQTGDSLKPVVLDPVSRIDLIKYAGASGDFNPIHTIDDEAKKAGLPGIIAHGMWTMGNLAKLFSDYYEVGFIENYSIRFKNMVFLNDVITLSSILEKTEENSLYFKVNAKNQNDVTVLTGKILFKIHE
ncbi:MULTISPECIES: MaoC/PaaZ C-terminal domain-containing protein [unclassified Bacillus (in: firmicutes)]|uniref:MaoC/PaaZ C-terminal domain-containing protein n=1 Tax=unclassified Bacillus (in: firmicutes) TaxID=185979 RepID=UPI000BF00E39|nr:MULTISPECIES: MaoC/PaaZ C-terminal domain-containing protein [unclassified Bacillus (in: firmicutes)]PEJ57265.1 dehydratase [Bacillus sp. AFS002410]PEL13257.1 dehydratase [Bacillus sp. AFS017336]